MERRFVIIDINSRPGNNWLIEYNRNDIVIESELKYRLDAAWGAVSKFAPSSTWDWDKAIDIVVNGEKERKEGKSRLVYNKETRTIDSVAPDGSKIVKPTRKEWEEWASRFTMMIKHPSAWTDLDIEEHVLLMPGVPA